MKPVPKIAVLIDLIWFLFCQRRKPLLFLFGLRRRSKPRPFKMEYKSKPGSSQNGVQDQNRTLKNDTRKNARTKYSGHLGPPLGGRLLRDNEDGEEVCTAGRAF